MLDKIAPTRKFPQPPHHPSGGKGGSGPSTGGDTSSSVPALHGDNVTNNDTTSGVPTTGTIFTKDSGFGLNKLSYVGPIVMGFGGKYDFIIF